MPTYDLTCGACGWRFERFVPRMLRDDDRLCPACGAPDARAGIGGGVLGAGTTSLSGGATGTTAREAAASCGTGSFG